MAIACGWSERNSVLGEVIQVYGGPKARVIIFTETKKEANELLVEESIKGACAALHGDIPQAQRENTLKGFRDGKFPSVAAQHSSLGNAQNVTGALPKLLRATVGTDVLFRIDCVV
jgi:hypothetical protein